MVGHAAPGTADIATMRSYESIQYLSPNSAAYRKGKRALRWAASSENRQRWGMAALIGFSTGVVAYLLKKWLLLFEITRLRTVNALALHHKLWQACVFSVSSAFLLAAGAAAITAFWAPAARASGVPEVIAYLNGVTIRRAFNLRTALAKFASCGLAVASGLAAGPEGPMIHLGAIIGRGLSQMESKALGINFLSAFPALRNSQDLRDHVSIGAACGVSAAFGAPIGGLLFAAEEVACAAWRPSRSALLLAPPVP